MALTCGCDPLVKQDPGDITQYFQALKRRNEYEDSEIDKVFLMRQEKERAIMELEAQCRQIQVCVFEYNDMRASVCVSVSLGGVWSPHSTRILFFVAPTRL